MLACRVEKTIARSQISLPRTLNICSQILLLCGSMACGLAERGSNTPPLEPQKLPDDLPTEIPTPPDKPTPIPDPHQCDNPVPSSGCVVTQGSDDVIIMQGTLLLPTGQLERGQVRIEGSTITCVGCDCDVATATHITCGDTAISPGLINPHDHLGWTHDVPVKINHHERFEHRHDWRNGDPEDQDRALNTHGGANNAELTWGELRQASAGTTSIIGSESAPGLLRNLDVKREADLPFATGASTFPLGDSRGDVRRNNCRYPKIVTDTYVNNQKAYVPHVGEGIDGRAQNELRCIEGVLPGAAHWLSPRVALVHAIAVDAIDAERIAQANASVVWSPRSNLALYGNTAPIPLLTRLGVSVALGTDWIPTGSATIPREMQCARHMSETYWNTAIADQDLWWMVTGAAAKAAGQPTLGVLREGGSADIALFAIPDGRPYNIADRTAEHTRLVLRGGKPIFGDTEIVKQLTNNCTTIPSNCTTEKTTCLPAPFNTYQDLANTVGTTGYGLYLCEALPDEPHCEAYTLVSSEHDQDHDGIDDANDNCPSMFNPPLADVGAVQADHDHDGQGDMCDLCPLGEQACLQTSQVDPDGDGILAVNDLCQDVYDTDNSDSDHDGHGDACDACPNEPNPGDQACSIGMRALKETGAPLGSAVALHHVRVTTTTAKGYFVQDTNSSSVDFSGILIKESVPAARPPIGSTIVLRFGIVERSYGQTRLSNATWHSADSAPQEIPWSTSVESINASTSSINTARMAYDGVTVTLDNIRITQAQSTALPQTLKTDTNVSILFANPIDASAFIDQTVRVTGVLNRTSGWELWPRSVNDLVNMSTPPAPDPTPDPTPEPTPAPVGDDLGGFTLVQTNAARTFTLSPGTVVPPGHFLIVARKVSKTDFEAYWHITLPSNVTFINSGDKFPSLNGDETIQLRSASGVLLADESPELVVGTCAERTLDGWASHATPSELVLPENSHPTEPTVRMVCDTSAGSGIYINEFILIER